jgi:riboflavin synthase
MFTGLVAERGHVLGDPAPAPGGGVRLTLGHSATLGERLSLGASLAVSGVCLTVIELHEHEGPRTTSTVEMGDETLRRTTLGELEDGSMVNLETPLAAGEPLGGHWVQGHVDGTLEVLERTDHEEHSVMAFSLPPELAPFLVEKGSVALDGVSLTVAGLERDRFTVWLIPHTLEVTTLGLRAPGDRVNFEADILAKYVYRGLEALAAGLELPSDVGPGPDPAGPGR